MKRFKQESKEPPLESLCPIHRIPTKACEGKVCKKCASNLNVIPNGKTSTLLGSESPRWIHVSIPHYLHQNLGSHYCGCMSLKKGSYLPHKHFVNFTTTYLSYQNREKVAIYVKVLNWYKSGVISMVQIERQYWLDRNTTKIPWTLLSRPPCTEENPPVWLPPRLIFQEDYVLKEDLYADLPPTLRLFSYQGLILKEMQRRSSLESMTKVITNSLKPDFGGKILALPTFFASRHYCVSTLKRKSILHQSICSLLDSVDMRPGGTIVLPPGYGKTVIGVAWIKMCKLRKEATPPSLILCPTTIIPIWIEHLSKWAPGLKVVKAYGSSKPDFAKMFEADVVVTSYGCFPRREEFLNVPEWDSIILDESHLLSEYSKTETTLRAFRFRHLWGLSATPTSAYTRLLHAEDLDEVGKPFRALDLSTILRIDPAPYTYDSGKPFIGLPPLESKDVEVTLSKDDRDHYETVLAFAKSKMDECNDPSLLRFLFERLIFSLTMHPFFSANLKLASDFLKMAKDTKDDEDESKRGDEICAICQSPFEAPVRVDPCDHLYCFNCLKTWWTGSRSARESCPVCRAHIGSFVFLNPEDKPKDSGRPEAKTSKTKMDAFLSTFRSLPKTHKAVIGTMTPLSVQEMVAYINNAFGAPIAEGLSYLVKPSARADVIKRFQTSPSLRVLIVQYSVAGTGIDLTAANHVFSFDPLLPSTLKTQLIGRVHRYGQSRKCTLHNLWAKDTIEEGISPPSGSSLFCDYICDVLST